ncbi:helix-turn-helix domain-containing protein [Singulisphaera rosea]
MTQDHGLVLRTARRWVDRYRREGLTGLARKERNDKDKRKLAAPLRQFIEGLALRKPRMPTATIHREVADAARKLGQESPSYKVVRALVAELEPALVTLAHEGSKAYSESLASLSTWSIATRRTRPTPSRRPITPNSTSSSRTVTVRPTGLG